MMSHHTRLREKNGDLHLLVRFGHRTCKSRQVFHLHLFITRETQSNHCSLGEPSYHGTPGGLILSTQSLSTVFIEVQIVNL